MYNLDTIFKDMNTRKDEHSTQKQIFKERERDRERERERERERDTQKFI